MCDRVGVGGAGRRMDDDPSKELDGYPPHAPQRRPRLLLFSLCYPLFPVAAFASLASDLDAEMEQTAQPRSRGRQYQTGHHSPFPQHLFHLFLAIASRGAVVAVRGHELGRAFNRDRMRDDLARGKDEEDGESVPDLAFIVRCEVERAGEPSLSAVFPLLGP